MAQLAIIGHKTRGKEVIEILEMLGGKNLYRKCGCEDGLFYYLSNEQRICSLPISESYRDFILFTLEEFLEKFPYKVGDKVIHDGDVLPIIGMKWDFSRNIVIYTLKYNYGEIDCYDCAWIKPYKEETFGESIEKTINECLFGCNEETMEGVYADNEINCYHQDFGDKVRIRLGNDFEIKIEDNVTYIVKKHPQYPKTYEECCKILGCKADDFFSSFGYNGCEVEISDYEDKIDDLLQNFRKLIYCRDAYWKIAGEEMGLGKPWSPSKNDDVYCIFRLEGEIVKDNFVFADSLILEFPTEEMRDAFYENFKDLIEKCKELL